MDMDRTATVPARVAAVELDLAVRVAALIAAEKARLAIGCVAGTHRGGDAGIATTVVRVPDLDQGIGHRTAVGVNDAQAHQHRQAVPTIADVTAFEGSVMAGADRGLAIQFADRCGGSAEWIKGARGRGDGGCSATGPADASQRGFPGGRWHHRRRPGCRRRSACRRCRRRCRRCGRRQRRGVAGRQVLGAATGCQPADERQAGEQAGTAQQATPCPGSRWRSAVPGLQHGTDVSCRG